MKKNIILVSGIIATALLAGCSSAPTSSVNTTSQDQELYAKYGPEVCTFKDGKSPAPAWVCGEPLDNYPVVGIAFSNSGSIREAVAKARVDLAARIRTTVESEEKAKSKTNGRTEQTGFASVDLLTVEESLYNTRRVLTAWDPSSNDVHVAVVADTEAYERSLRDAMQRQSVADTLDVGE